MGHTEEKVSTANTFDMRTLNVEITSCSIASKNCDNYELSNTNDIEYICTKSETFYPKIIALLPKLLCFWFLGLHSQLYTEVEKQQQRALEQVNSDLDLVMKNKSPMEPTICS